MAALMQERLGDVLSISEVWTPYPFVFGFRVLCARARSLSLCLSDVARLTTPCARESSPSFECECPYLSATADQAPSTVKGAQGDNEPAAREADGSYWVSGGAATEDMGQTMRVSSMVTVLIELADDRPVVATAAQAAQTELPYVRVFPQQQPHQQQQQSQRAASMHQSKRAWYSEGMRYLDALRRGEVVNGDDKLCRWRDRVWIA